MISKFQFISKDFELPLLDNKSEWLTNMWVYVIVGLLGACAGLSAMRQFFISATFSEAASITAIYGILVIMPVWAGCTATAFCKIPVLEYAVKRSIFNLIAITLVYFVCALLGVLAMLAIIVVVVGGLLAAGGGRSKSADSSTPNEIYDENGNVHYVSQSIGRDRVQTTDGNVMRRNPDGKYSNID